MPTDFHNFQPDCLFLLINQQNMITFIYLQIHFKIDKHSTSKILFEKKILGDSLFPNLIF